ncbi:MAG TPA: sigma-70 family RNA polymerase sigma factor [Candidatus Polarisedimenticolia bacterium]|nr:sigma-70 family RNA polymerase sigma factor [Candidatus Polarisedimenticolia bacterium]
MPNDTDLGRPVDRFPTTHWSAVIGSSSPDADERLRSFETLVTAYWKPVYKYVRVKWSKTSEDAADLTQEFFTRALEKEFFAPFDPVKGRFRTFLRTCLDRFLANEHKSAKRLKRGGEAILLSLDFDGAEGELRGVDLPSTESPDRFFDTEWVRGLFELAVAALRDYCRLEGKEPHFRIFERYDLQAESSDRPTYADLAKELGLPVTQVTNHLAFARREFRRLLLAKLREITVSDEEFRKEARLLLGSEPD